MIVHLCDTTIVASLGSIHSEWKELLEMWWKLLPFCRITSNADLMQGGIKIVI